MVGIVKSKTLKSGAVGEFWKITAVNMDLLTGRLSVRLSLYINQTAFNTGKSPLSMSKIYELSIAPSDLTGGGDIRDVVWDKVKAKASSLVSKDLLGDDITPVAFDPDIDGGADV